MADIGSTAARRLIGGTLLLQLSLAVFLACILLGAVDAPALAPQPPLLMVSIVFWQILLVLLVACRVGYSRIERRRFVVVLCGLLLVAMALIFRESAALQYTLRVEEAIAATVILIGLGGINTRMLFVMRTSREERSAGT